MMKDRDQKRRALRLAAAARWLPQLEVDVVPTGGLSKVRVTVTDLDVFVSIPDVFSGFRGLIVDCKTKKSESPVNRCLWLSGVMRRLGADRGLCVMKKNSIDADHRLFAATVGVVLLEDAELDTYARSIAPDYDDIDASVADIDIWESVYAEFSKYPTLAEAALFIRSSYWMIEDASEACRKSLMSLAAVRGELDPSKLVHQAMFFEFCAVFSRSLAVIATRVFNTYLHPSRQDDLEECLLVMLYGGRDAYEHRKAMFDWARQKVEGGPKELSLPEWGLFVQLVRQLLDAPGQAQMVPLVLREAGFGVYEDRSSTFLRSILGESPHSGKFALLVAGYLSKAARLPPEFAKIADQLILGSMEKR